MSIPPPPQPPAIKSYFFGKGYTDLWATISDAWRRNWESASIYGGKGSYCIDREFPENFLAAFWYGAALSVVIFGTLFTAVLSLLHILILGAFFSVIYILFSIVATFERVIMLFRGFFTVCPNCHHRVHLPVYFCDNDNCKTQHPYLIPSSFGIFHHTCRCGQELPCTLFTNRGRLLAKCPKCVTILTREHTESRKQFIPIIGGTQVGKSAYLFSLSRHLIEVTAPSLGMKADFMDEHQKNVYQHVTNSMDEYGTPPNKTMQILPRAFDILFQREAPTFFQRNSKDLALYFYDPAGEAFLDVDQLVPHQFLGYLSGIILLVDPFAFAEVQVRYPSLMSENLMPSSMDVTDIVTRLINAMERDFNLKPGDKVKVPLAVVINKVDAFDLEDIIGERAVDLYPLKKAREPRKQRRNRKIKEVLISWESNILCNN
jgi:hypothetical protein